MKSTFATSGTRSSSTRDLIEMVAQFAVGETVGGEG